MSAVIDTPDHHAGDHHHGPPGPDVLGADDQPQGHPAPSTCGSAS
ncbi:hypothetical protein ACPA9J_15275 [Pseudomonas aeruginosa]